MKTLMKTTILAGLLSPMAAMAQDEQVTLNWVLWGMNNENYWVPLMEAYEEKNPNITFEYTDLGSADYSTMLMTQLTGRAENIDIVSIKDTPSYADLIRTGNLVNLTEELEEPVDPEPYAGAIEQLTVDGSLYGLPFRSDIWLLYYNKDIFDAAGVEYPTNDMTWAEHDELARELTSGFGVNKVYGSHFHTWNSLVQVFATMDGENTLISDDYSFLQPYYERVLSLQEDGAIQDYAALQTSQTHYSGPFYNSQVAMMPMGTWFIGTQIAKVESGESLSSNWGLASMPVPEGVEPGTTAATLTPLGVNAASPNKEEALDFVQWAAGPEAAEILAGFGNIPALRNDEVIEAIASLPGFPDDETSREALRPTQTYLEMPVDMRSSDIGLLLNRNHQNIMTQNVSIEEGIEDLNADIAEVLN
ncbi:extracellular solute-binding protein [Pelagovum pacificum]|uniref:Extracellular solute-binding protein n=1 Tax=Pelagovum pacificum TaxID=2588711 RepID=A0A5C5GGW4_9RHOB|nr:extracellular solute-binding protein [Pelagovum pacificum]QQA43388.1 extracellular solute-binding protein [Pelagovum pacificum]TNY33474.1 extracellular solute-binding protein [Pelagovum pacificum]